MDNELSDKIEKVALLILVGVGILTILSTVFDFSLSFSI